MRDRRDKGNKTVAILIAVIVVLVLVLAFFFLVRPGISKFVQNKQIEGVNFAYTDVVTQVQENGYFALPLGQNEAGEDQTLILVQYVPEQQAPPAQ